MEALPTWTPADYPDTDGWDRDVVKHETRNTWTASGEGESLGSNGRWDSTREVFLHLKKTMLYVAAVPDHTDMVLRLAMPYSASAEYLPMLFSPATCSFLATLPICSLVCTQGLHLLRDPVRDISGKMLLRVGGLQRTVLTGTVSYRRRNINGTGWVWHFRQTPCGRSILYQWLEFWFWIHS